MQAQQSSKDNQMALSEKELMYFASIKSFIEDIYDTYGKRVRSVALYQRLLSKTTLQHSNHVRRHISIFREFCETNRPCILSKGAEGFKNSNLRYSDKISVNIKDILKLCDQDEQRIIMQHLLTISALLDPTANAKGVLSTSQTTATSGESRSREGDLLANLMANGPGSLLGEMGAPAEGGGGGVVEQIMSVMQNGAFGELLGGLMSGEFDVANIFSIVQNLMRQQTDAAGDGEGGEMDQATLDIQNQCMDMMKNMQNLMNSMTKKSEPTTPTPPATVPTASPPSEIESVVEKPATEPVVKEPASEPVVEELASEPVVEEPASEPVVEEPASEPVVEPIIEEATVVDELVTKEVAEIQVATKPKPKTKRGRKKQETVL